MAARAEALPASTSDMQKPRPKLKVLERNLDHEAIRPSIGEPQPELYDCSREGTESLPQLARVILSVMLKQENELVKPNKQHRDIETCVNIARERANDRFLEFVSENEAMSSLDVEYLSELTRRSPVSISAFFEDRARKSA